MRKQNKSALPQKLNLQKRSIVLLNKRATAAIAGGKDTTDEWETIIPSKIFTPDTGCTTGGYLTHLLTKKPY